MKRTLWVTLVALAPLTATATPAVAQRSEIPEEMQAKRLPRQHLSGPRFGFTAFTGDIARMRSDLGQSPIMSQFGWQFETQLVSTEDGHRALLEWVLLAGGVEQDALTLSVSTLAGLRFPSGFEFGVGPNFSVRKGSSDPTTSMVTAVGATLPFGGLYVPVNLAVAFAEGGPRFTTLLGWIVG